MKLNIKTSFNMKQILLAASMAIVLVSCAKNEADSPLSFREIKFVNLNDKVNTRAANDSSSDYRVYAKWTGATTAWFINDTINGKGTNANKPQSNIYYWPANGTVDFYSWAPATSTNVSVTAIYPNISIAYTVPTTAKEDFTVAMPKTGMNTGTVNFKFSHMLAKITVAVDLKDSLKDAGYSVTFPNGKAKLSVKSTSATIDPTATPLNWTSPNTSSVTYTGDTTYIIMPQTSTGCSVQALDSVIIWKGGMRVFTGSLSSYTIATNDVPSNKFEQGKHYRLKMTISARSTDSGGNSVFGPEIKFSADTTAWVPSNPTLTQP